MLATVLLRLELWRRYAVNDVVHERRFFTQAERRKEVVQQPEDAATDQKPGDEGKMVKLRPPVKGCVAATV
jgi:hypothetical protein